MLHLTPDLGNNQNAREVVDFSIQAHRQGWRPIVASAGGDLVIEAERAAVRHARIPLNVNNFVARWRSRFMLEALYQRVRPKIVHAHGFEVLAQASRVSFLHHVPLLVDLTDPAPFTRERRKLLQTAAQRRTWFRVPSAFMAEHLRQEHGLDSGFLYQVPPGVDMQWFDAARVSPERLQKLGELWRLPEQAAIILMPAPLAPGYGHKQLLEAMTRLRRKDIFAVFVGSDKTSPGTRSETEKLVLSCGLGERVVMPEVCPDWPAACWLSTIVVSINTTPRGQSLELLSAQAMGRPVIVTDCGANTEMVKGGETAWVISPGNVDMLTQALGEAASMNQSQRINLAVRARTFVAEAFSGETWRSSMIGLYESMLGRPPSMAETS